MRRLFPSWISSWPFAEARRKSCAICPDLAYVEKKKILDSLGNKSEAVKLVRALLKHLSLLLIGWKWKRAGLLLAMTLHESMQVYFMVACDSFVIDHFSV